jgi:hypothetical protein
MEPHLLVQIPLLLFADLHRDTRATAGAVPRLMQFHPKKKTVRGSPEASREVPFNRLG